MPGIQEGSADTTNERRYLHGAKPIRKSMAASMQGLVELFDPLKEQNNGRVASQSVSALAQAESRPTTTK